MVELRVGNGLDFDTVIDVGRLVLLAAPAAVDYQPRLGFQRYGSAWTLEADRPLDEP